MNPVQSTSRWWHRRTPRDKRFLAGAGLLLAAAAASLSIFATAPAPSAELNPEKAWSVSTISITPGPLSPVFSSYGRVESTDIAVLRTDVVAPIFKVNVRAGQWVNKGDVLVQLETTELALQVTEREADVAQQRAQLASITTEYQLLEETTGHFKSVYDLSQKKLKRHEDLLHKRMISRSLLDEVVQQADQSSIQYQTHMRSLADFPNRIASQQAQLKRALAQWQQARIKLHKANIKAPFSGAVLEVGAAPGNYSSMSAALVRLASNEGLEIRAPVSNSYVERFRNAEAGGGAIQASAQLNGDRVAVTFSRLASNVRLGQSGVDAYFQIKPLPDSPLPEVGRVMQLTITLPPEAFVVALPVQSLYDNDRIYEVLDRRLHAITIERVGDYRTESGDYRLLVRSPKLTAGQHILSTQLPRAISGLLVERVNGLPRGKGSMSTQ